MGFTTLNINNSLQNYNKKIHKKFSDNNFYSKAKIFRKIFLRRQRGGWVWQRGGAVYYSNTQSIQAQCGRIAHVLSCAAGFGETRHKKTTALRLSRCTVLLPWMRLGRHRTPSCVLQLTRQFFFTSKKPIHGGSTP